MQRKNCAKFGALSTVFFVALIASGLALLLLWPLLVEHLVSGNMLLANGSHVQELWRRFPDAFPIDFYFFNWTNAEEVYREGVKPRFRQMGPYKFLERKEKTDVVWNDGNGTVTFRQRKVWKYDAGVNGELGDRVTVVNPVALSAVYSSRSWSYLIRKGLSVSLSSMAPTIQITKTVGEMLFEGYRDPLMSLGRSLPFLGASLPNWDKFGWFYTRNGSSLYEGTFNMGTGYSNSIFGHLYSWNTWSQTPYYEGSCSNVESSAGEFFEKPSKTFIRFFSPDLCRIMVLRYTEEVTVSNILGYKFVVDDYMLENGTVYPENKCSCNGECVPSGLLNVSSCRYGSPSFASLPHFYQADDYYVNTIEGLQPDKEKHEFYMILEPTTGIPLEVAARLQINLLMQPMSGISMYEKAPRVFMPMLWFEQRVRIPESEAFMLRLLLNLPVICISVGAVLILIGCVVLLCFVYKLCTMNLCGGRNENIVYVEQCTPLKMKNAVELVKQQKDYY